MGKCDETAVTLFHSRQSDDEWCRPVDKPLCDSCRRAVSTIQGCLFSDSDQPHFKQEQPLSHECNKLGQLQTDYSVYKKHIAERTGTTAAVQGVMVETWKYENEDYVFQFGHEVSVNVQRRETHN